MRDRSRKLIVTTSKSKELDYSYWLSDDGKMVRGGPRRPKRGTWHKLASKSSDGRVYTNLGTMAYLVGTKGQDFFEKAVQALTRYLETRQ